MNAPFSPIPSASDRLKAFDELPAPRWVARLLNDDGSVERERQFVCDGDEECAWRRIAEIDIWFRRYTRGFSSRPDWMTMEKVA